MNTLRGRLLGIFLVLSLGGLAIIGFLAVSLAMINVIGGYTVTHRMLRMFKSKG